MIEKEQFMTYFHILMWNVHYTSDCKKSLIYNHRTEIDMSWDMYFLWSVDNPSKYIWTWKRFRDNDIVEKNYICVDLDIRKEMWISYDEQWDEILLDKISDAVEIIDQHEVLKTYDFIVHSWNWIHVYYTWPFPTNKQDYADWYNAFITIVQKALPWYWADSACSNIWRLLRMPYSKNMKYNRGIESYVYRWNMMDCTVSEMFNDLILIEREKRKKLAEVQILYTMNKWWNTIIDKINNSVQVDTLACKHFWIEMQKDWKNFKSNRDGKNMWLFYDPEKNILYSNSIWNKWLTDKWYNAFNFVKKVMLNTQDTKEVINWFTSKFNFN